MKLNAVIRAGVATAAVGTGLALIPAAGASAAPLHCGEKITKDTTLSQDLTGCESNGLVIGADNITIDLRGHVLGGDGKLFSKCKKNVICDDGIVSIGHSGVRITGGTVKGFALGALLRGGSKNAVSGMVVKQNQFGGVTSSSSKSLFETSTYTANGPRKGGVGLNLFHAIGARVVKNNLTGNGAEGLVLDGSNNAAVDENTIRNNPELGILDESSKVIISRNDIRRTGDGVVISGNANTVISNQVTCGCRFTGVAIQGGSHNVITGNRVSGAGLAGIQVFHDAESPATAANKVDDNVITASVKDGIRIDKGTTGTRLIHNLAISSGRNGFTVSSPSATLKRNVAIGSKALGFDAVAGVTDAGKNRSRGGGCRHVRC